MKRIVSKYREIGHALENLKPVRKYVVHMLMFLGIGLAVGLVESHFSGPGSPPSPWREQVFVWTFLGASSAFWSERRRKHPKPPPPVTRYTNPKYLK